jgi:hypothetical protein
MAKGLGLASLGLVAASVLLRLLPAVLLFLLSLRVRLPLLGLAPLVVVIP